MPGTFSSAPSIWSRLCKIGGCLQTADRLLPRDHACVASRALPTPDDAPLAPPRVLHDEALTATSPAGKARRRLLPRHFARSLRRVRHSCLLARLLHTD